MLNIEKYKDEILNAKQAHSTCSVYDIFLKLSHISCPGNCKECKKNVMEWLLEEYSEPILDDVEREYLSAVIKPFRNKIATISKLHTYDSINYENNEYIYFGMKDRRGYSLPLFKQGTMYKGMQQGKHYTLKELGL